MSILALAASTPAQDAGVPGVLTEMPLPGGLRAALGAIGDPVPGDRSQFLLEVIRRAYDSTGPPDSESLRPLLAHLERSAEEPDTAHETLPLPLSPALWTKVVFHDGVAPRDLVGAILRSPGAARLYCGLLSLDNATRAWLATEPELLADLASLQSEAFVVAAPGLRVAGGVVQVPGGKRAGPVWEALVGRSVNDPVAFTRALLRASDGRLAGFLGAVSTLTTSQIAFVLALDSADVSRRIDAGRRVSAVFSMLTGGLDSQTRTFWRPSIDPVLLAADLAVDERGRPMLPGTQRFWSAIFAARTDLSAAPDVAQSLAQGEPVDFAWLSEQVFHDHPLDRRSVYLAVLFASRRIRHVTAANVADAVETIRAAIAFPALVAALERAGLDDVSAFASAARRASRLSAVRDDAAALRAVTQFQGTLVIVTRAVLRGSLPREALPRLVSSLSAVDVNAQGEYKGGLVRWLDANLQRDVIPLLAGPTATEPRFVDWEGTRYRFDPAAAEATRLGRLLDDRQRPATAVARAFVQVADDLGKGDLTRERVQHHAATLAEIARESGPDDQRGAKGAAELDHAARSQHPADAARLASSFLSVADDELARGVLQIAYALAVGQGDPSLVDVSELAARHDFSLRGAGPPAAWRFPTSGSRAARGAFIRGSLLGLDAALAPLSLIRVSSLPPAQRPSLNNPDRSVFVESVALVNPASLIDADRDAIVAAIGRGRARLAAARSAADAAALADDARLSPARRSLLAWVIAHDPDRAGAFLGLTELLWAGLGEAPMPESFRAWGASASPRLGCLCVELLDPRPLDAFAGRWNTGLLASGFADLNLRLAELLAALRMPASLLAPVLASATPEFVDGAVSRDRDDRRGLLEYVFALDRDRVEQYLATLTTDGPLVPVTGAGSPAVVMGVPR